MAVDEHTGFLREAARHLMRFDEAFARQRRAHAPKMPYRP